MLYKKNQHSYNRLALSFVNLKGHSAKLYDCVPSAKKPSCGTEVPLIEFILTVHFSLSCLENIFALCRKTGTGTVSCKLC